MSHNPPIIYHQITCKLFFLTLLLLVMAHPAQAYYLTQSPEPFTMPGERENAPSSDKKGVFTVQDNFNLFTKNDGTSPILLPHSDYFIAADIIDINLPIFGIFSHPAQPAKDPLANLLYANLKIKQLLEEFEAIQASARDLLGKNIPHSPSFDLVTDKSTYQMKKRQATPLSIHSKTQHFNRKISIIRAPLFLDPDKYQAKRQNTQPTPNAMVPKNLKKYSIQTSKHLQTFYYSFNRPSQTKKQVSVNLPRSTTKQQAQDKQAATPAPPRSHTTIDMVLLKTFNYITQHKLESAIYGIFIFITLYFVSLIINLIFGSRH